MSSFQKDGIILRLTQIDEDKLKSILNDITEVRINLDEKEWLVLFDRFEILSKGELQ